MKTLFILFLLIGLNVFADPEYSRVYQYLNSISPDASDQEAIAGLVKMNVSNEAKKEVGVERATTMRRYDLAKYMTENGYKKLTEISEVFSRPFQCYGAPNNMPISNKSYTQEEMITYVDYFVNSGTKVTASNVNWIKTNKDFSYLYDHLKSKLNENQLKELDQMDFDALLSDGTKNLELLKKMIAEKDVKINPDALRIYRLNSIEFTQFLIDNGANINTKGAFANVINSGNLNLVKYFVDKGGDPCEKSAFGGNMYDLTKRYIKKAKTKTRKQNLKAIKDFLKPLTANCKS